MKIRNGFVSNSSSSSFICDVTGQEVCGYDITLEDYDLCECEHGHIFPADMIIGEDSEDDDDCWSVSEKRCPICQCKVALFPTGDRLTKYAAELLGMSVEQLSARFKELKVDSEYVKKYS